MILINHCMYSIDSLRIITTDDKCKATTLGASIASNVLGFISMARY